jgi:hypothetical protein
MDGAAVKRHRNEEDSKAICLQIMKEVHHLTKTAIQKNTDEFKQRTEEAEKKLDIELKELKYRNREKELTHLKQRKEEAEKKLHEELKELKDKKEEEQKMLHEELQRKQENVLTEIMEGKLNEMTMLFLRKENKHAAAIQQLTMVIQRKDEEHAAAIQRKDEIMEAFK